MDSSYHLWIIPVLPLLGAAVNGLVGVNRSKQFINAVGVGTVALAFLRCVYLFFGVPFGEHGITETVAPWIAAGSFQASFTFYLDQLSMVMILVVTGVGLLIHIYSTGYMAHEGGYYRFFSYLNLFTFFMLMLVLAGNYLLLFVGWEGVGLCSYLLIGFWFKKQSASDAGKKAFIVNRVGDFGFALALLLIFGAVGSLDYSRVFAAVGTSPLPGNSELLTTICLLLMVGAAGKSAQIPLYVWLPDAMEGPTPVSALIHAATMVTAGVYMVARSGALFTAAPDALNVVAIVGCATAIFSATIGLVQTDIKRVLAYSTVSQLGYMFLGCGVAAFSAGIFHLMTHAFFKALLFLAAGSVIHAMSGQQDMRHMGGLKKKIPLTYWTFFAGCLAIAGVPPFAGFFSKDEILWKAYSSGHTVLWAIGMLTAAMTAFYVFRLFFLTFYGEHRSEEAHHAHESPASMTYPLIGLAVLSVAGGWVGWPHAMFGENRFEKFLEPAFAFGGGAEHAAAGDTGMELLFSGMAILAGALGIFTAYYCYIMKPDTGENLSKRFAAVYDVLLHKYYVDEIYNAVFVQPIIEGSRGLLWKVLDVGVIDGIANGTADSARGLGGMARRLQSGNIRSYAVWVAMGAVMTVLGMLWAR